MTRPDLHGLLDELEAQIEVQREKVLILARRLRPGLTAEDIRNPHDFPELTDPDWHFADGELAAYQTIALRVRALLREEP